MAEGGIGWWAMDCAAWPVIADALTAAGRPWPEEAILADLRWWADQARLGRAVRPGRPALQRRWLVGDTVARRLMRAEDVWACPLHAAATSDRPAGNQKATSRREVECRESVEVDQRPNSDQPAIGPTRDPQSTETEAEIEPPPTPSAVAAGATGSLGPVLVEFLAQLPVVLLDGLAQRSEAALRELRAELRQRRRWPADAPRLRGAVAVAVADLARARLDEARQRDAAAAVERDRQRAEEAARCLADAAHLGVHPPPVGEIDPAVLAAMDALYGERAIEGLRRVAIDARTADEADRRLSQPRPAPRVDVEERADRSVVQAKLAAFRQRIGRAA